MPISTVNPATGQTLRVFDALSARQIEEKLSLAQSAFPAWRQVSFAHRAGLLKATAQLLEAEKLQLGRLLTQEMGKTLVSAIAEVEKCAIGCRYFATHAEAMLAPTAAPSAATSSFIQYVPLGAILGVMPWNFPFWQVFRFAVPALMAGNTVLLKHASNVPQCALAIEDIFRRAGLPEGVMLTLLIEADQVEEIAKDPRIAAISLTGSEPAGRSVATAAASVIKKCVLELGGSDAFIVMPSANIELAAATAVKARVINNGQTCIAAKRFIVDTAIYDRFSALFVDGMRNLQVGDPVLPATQLGPLASAKLRDDLHGQVTAAIEAGAKLLTGGHLIDGPGFYYQPTVLEEVPRNSPSFHEEFFGPVAMLFRARNSAHALEIANDSPFGLSASVWTQDAGERDFFVHHLETGMIFVNAISASTPELPFGGIKRSGYGRELGELGIREFVNIQTVWIG